MSKYTFILLCLILSLAAAEGQQMISIEDLWRDNTFYTRSVPGFTFLNDGKHYTRLQNKTIKKYDLTTGEQVGDILKGDDLKGKSGFNGNISSYELYNDGQKILIASEEEGIYRRSSKAYYHIYDVNTQQLTPVWDGPEKVMYATLDPKGEKIAFVHQNDLYYKDLKKNKTIRITNDGRQNAIINGASDWVYEEEFSIAQNFFWSPDGKRIAFIRFDESEVREFTMTKYYDELYPVYETFKYPKVGEKNAKVSAHLVDIDNNKVKKIDIGSESDIYIPRIKWSKDKNKLIVYKMNRHQNELTLYAIDAKKNKSKVLFKETNKYYIDITDDLTFLEEDGQFIWTSEKSGYNHIYLYDENGKELRALTSGDYDVTTFYGVDEDRKLVYYQASETSPLEKHIYSVDLKGKNKQNMVDAKGSHSAQFSTTFDYFIDNYSTANTAPTYTVYDRKGKVVRVIEDNVDVAGKQGTFGVSPVEFFEFTTSENVRLNGWMIKPSDFDPNYKYPVFMTQYSGPGSQQVTDSWKGNNYWWYQQIAQHDYLVVCVDPRGTGGRGEEFKKMTYLQLGKYETMDQIEAAKYLGKQPYVDASRIGIYGWSYGGYMSSLCILKGNDVFKAAIAVAPVTSWKWYDTVYTERYMRTLAENEAGYKDNSPVYFADRLKGNYLLIHGIGDDNVHFQNTAEMTNALIKANKQFDTYLYPNRNHGIYGDNARLHLWAKMNDFIFNKI